MNRMSYVAVAGAAAIMLASGLNCSGGDSSGPGRTTITDFITRVQASNGTITAQHSNQHPPASGAGPDASISGGSSVINGGSSLLTVTSTDPFDEVFVTVAGYDGYYWVALPGAVTTVDLQLTMGRHIPDNSFSLEIGVAELSVPGVFAAQGMNVVQAGTGQVQVSVSWNAPSDVDLHVIEPGGEEIYYGNPSSAAGGALDLDSNADCGIDNVDNENINWASNAPHGSYTVRVDYYKGCGVGATDYVVTVQRKNMTPEVFRGTFTGSGDQGGLGSGVTVTTFTF